MVLDRVKVLFEVIGVLGRGFLIISVVMSFLRYKLGIFRVFDIWIFIFVLVNFFFLVGVVGWRIFGVKLGILNWFGLVSTLFF